MQVQINLNGVLTSAGMNTYSTAFKAKLLLNTRKAMQTVGKEYKTKMQDNAKSKLKVKKPAFIKSISYKVYFQRAGKTPSLHFYSRVPWMGMHDKGGMLTKNVFIPLSKKRLGYKEMKTLIRNLRSAGNLFFEKRGGTTIAWAKNTQQFKSVLTPFRAVMKAQNGGKTIKKDERVNVAIVSKNTRLKKKIRMTELALESLPKIKREIERLFTI